MSTHSSGYYSIDEKYNIISFNDTAKEIYPNLKTGEKCYQALMGLDSPCPPCPVANGIYGPKTYLDPIRHIYETVDAVKTVHADGSRGHALVFSTVAEGERLAEAIPTGEASLRLLGAVNLLASKYSAVFGVNMNTEKISVFRYENLFGNTERELADNMDYHEVAEKIVRKYVNPEDKNSVMDMLLLKNVRGRLAKARSFKVHLKVQREEVHYYYMQIARNGEANDFEDIVVAIACEDDDINTRRIYEKQLESLVSSLTHAPGYFHLDITADKILNAGGTSEFIDILDKDGTIDALLQSMAEYIRSEKDRKDFMHAFNLECMKRDYEAGKVEIVRESLCYYDDHIARWSRYTIRLFVNPSNNHLEGVFYGTDISADKEAYETQVSIVQTLSSNYRDVLLLNTREKTATLIKHEGFMSHIMDRDYQKVYSYEELLDKYIVGYVHPDDQAMMRSATKLDHVLTELLHGKEYTGNYRIIDQGRESYYQFRFIKNEEYGIIVLGFLNIDDIVSAEIEQQQKLQKALETAERANAEKSRFLARMSHDMRTPLNGILGILEINKKHAEDIEFLKETRQKATVAANHLISLINDVLDMAKIEEGNMVLAHEAFNMRAHGREASEMISIQAQEAGIAVVLNVEPWDTQLDYVYGSPLHLRRALMNIYSNCIKYNRSNGIIETNVEVIKYDRKTVTYRWTIHDTGIGMSEEFLAKMYEPFVQADTDARSIYQGTGLGMSIAKAIIDQMGGTLEVSSELNVGSTFVVTIPFERADPESVNQAHEMENVSIKGMHILLVEDNELNRDVAETILTEEGAELQIAVNGKEAVDMIRDNPPGTFDVVLMDVMMPVMDGYEAVENIRQMGRADTDMLPIIAMTANAFAEDVQKCLDVGMNAHIAKPLDVDRMLRIIAQYRR